MSLPSSRLTDITFHLIVEAAPNAVLLVNQEGRIAYVNRKSELLFGYQADEMIGQPVKMLVPERLRGTQYDFHDGMAAVPEWRQRIANRGELFALRKDGSEFPVELALNPLVLVDGTWVLATIIDITARKQAEDRFREVVHAAPNAIVLVNRHKKIELVNQQVNTLFGYEESELLGQPVSILIPERFRGRHDAYMDGFFADPQSRSMGAGRDLAGRRKDGTEIPIEIGLNPMQTEAGLMVLASLIDITERREQEQLRLKKEAAEAAYKAKGELLAVASHDLKNPLSAIAGLSEIMLEMKKADPAASAQDIEFLEGIHEASKHMSDVVKGILANEGLEQQRLSLEDVDASALCRDLVGFNRPAAGRKQIDLVEDVAPDIVLCADKTRLREAFDNYLSNAIKYSPGGRKVFVSLKALADGRQVEFGVRDQGPGLTDDDKAKAFGKFKKLSAKPTGGESSTGLGLSIVKTIVEMHGGSVGCDSVYGQGAYFWARLPLKKKP
jgi:protein-histidine pros-kinase